MSPPQPSPTTTSLPRAWLWVVVGSSAVVVVLAVVIVVLVLRKVPDSREPTDLEIRLAKLSCAHLSQVVQEYMALNDGQPPASLQVLTQPSPNGGGALIGPEKLKDPWGKEYQLDMSDPVQPVVFTVAPNGARISSQ